MLPEAAFYGAAPTARPVRAAAAGRRASLREPTASDDDDFIEAVERAAVKPNKKKPAAKDPRAPAAPRRRRSASPSSSSESDDDDDDDSSSDDETASEDGDRPAVHGAGAWGNEEEGEEEEDPAAAELQEVEAILAVRSVPASPPPADAGTAAAPGAPSATPMREEFRVKFKGRSYRDAAWVSGPLLRAVRRQLTSNFLARRAAATATSRGEDEEDEGDGAAPDEEEVPDLVEGVHPDWCAVERVLDTRRVGPQGNGASRAPTSEVLVKWCGLGYASATWEPLDSVEAEAVAAYRARQAPRKAAPAKPTQQQQPGGWREAAPPAFRSGRALRDYQLEGMRWLANAASAGRGCILGDEMGLGKTAQAISTLEFLRTSLARRGPFLVVAPLTTLGHWAREIETWTAMAAVVYVGTAADREVARATDWWVKDGARKPSAPSFDVLLTSYEILLKDRAFLVDKRLAWEAVVVDEAHRLKTTTAACRGVLTDMQAGGLVRWLLLLTGTPIQNNMKELFGLLNVLGGPAARPGGIWSDERAFLARYGGAKGVPPTPAQVTALQADLRPILLRRMKEDVEKSLPSREEVIVRVELTAEQRAYYKAIYTKRIGALLGGASKKALPQMRNLAMELRKVCCHPFLCSSLEEDFRARWAAAAAAKGADAGGKAAPVAPPSDLDALVAASGKMVLISKLLPKLRSEGRRVLIFSQFTSLLNLLEDAARGWGYPVERIDGGVPHRDRQAAIDRFTHATGDAAFIFLLSTRAGGQGITLTAADTAIIYDSDFNPQNDLQAMARCHRIGQDKDVTVYRLIANDTYEQTVFEAASRKYGLDEAILGTMPGGGGGSGSGSGASPGKAAAAMGDPEAHAGRIAALLKHGAHRLDAAGEAAAAAAGDAFEAEGIDQILAGRTEKRSVGAGRGGAGNTFSVATFTAEAEGSAPGDDKEYWARLLPEAAAAHAASRAAGLGGAILSGAPLGPRRRHEAGMYRDAAIEARLTAASADGGGGYGGSGRKQRGGGGKREGTPSDDGGPRDWFKYEALALEEALFSLGEGRWEAIAASAKLQARPLEEVREMCGLVLALARATFGGAGGEDGEAAPPARPGGGAFVPAKPPPAALAILEAAPQQYQKALVLADIAGRLARRADTYRERLDARSDLERVIPAVRAGGQEALRALFNATTIASRRTTVPGWWDRRLDKALLEALYDRGHNPAPATARAEIQALLFDEPDLPFLAAAQDWQGEQVAAALAAHDRAVAQSRAWEVAAARMEAERVANGGEAAAAAPPSPPRLPPPANPVDEAAIRADARDALVEGVVKRVRRLLRALAAPQKTVAVVVEEAGAGAAAPSAPPAPPAAAAHTPAISSFFQPKKASLKEVLARAAAADGGLEALPPALRPDVTVVVTAAGDEVHAQPQPYEEVGGDKEEEGGDRMEVEVAVTAAQPAPPLPQQQQQQQRTGRLPPAVAAALAACAVGVTQPKAAAAAPAVLPRRPPAAVVAAATAAPPSPAKLEAAAAAAPQTTTTGQAALGGFAPPLALPRLSPGVKKRAAPEGAGGKAAAPPPSKRASVGASFKQTVLGFAKAGGGDKNKKVEGQ